MARLDCSECIAYDDNGRLSAVIARDEPIECDDDGRLTWADPADVKPRVLNPDLLVEAPTDNNGLAIVGGQPVLEQRPIADYTRGEAGATPKSLSTLHQFGTTVTVPANPGCQPGVVIVTSTVRHKGAAGPNQDVYLFQQANLGGAVLAEVWRRRFAVPFQFDETHSHVLQFTRPPNAGPATYPLTYEIQSPDDVFLERFGICWESTIVSIKDCN